jgi:transposase
MAAPLISDEIWERIRTLLPEPAVNPTGGRPPIRDRDVLTGILFVLKTGILWQDLPEEMGCGCGMTCVRRLRQWQQSGTWPRMEYILRSRLRNAARYDWARAGNGARRPVREIEVLFGGEPEMAASQPWAASGR